MSRSGNRSTERKSAPVSLSLPQIPHDLTRDRMRAAVVGSRKLTTRATAQQVIAWPAENQAQIIRSFNIDPSAVLTGVTNHSCQVLLWDPDPRVVFSLAFWVFSLGFSCNNGFRQEPGLPSCSPVSHYTSRKVALGLCPSHWLILMGRQVHVSQSLGGLHTSHVTRHVAHKASSGLAEMRIRNTKSLHQPVLWLLLEPPAWRWCTVFLTPIKSDACWSYSKEQLCQFVANVKSIWRWTDLRKIGYIWVIYAVIAGTHFLHGFVHKLFEHEL